MLQQFDIWQMLAGVVLFLLGFFFMEESLKSLANRRFKLFLKKHTSNKLRAITGGAVITALMQSSSVMNLLILSFVGAGVIKMQQALAVMLGSNLGTTFTGWVIATVGFKLNIESLALPILACAGVAFFLARNGTAAKNWFRFFMGFSFLFVGLGYMNEGMSGMMQQINLAQLAASPLVLFILAGFVITALVQASSITIALALSALFNQVITLPMAAALVLGAEIGTTIKLALASVHGIATKKRVALGNILFNTITVFVVIIFLRPILTFIAEVLQVHDPLYALVVFQSLVNLVGIVLFFPFLNVFGQFLDNRFRDETSLEFLKKVNPAELEVALVGMEQESRHFMLHLFDFTRRVFDLEQSGRQLHPKDYIVNKKPLYEHYGQLKEFYGELHAFYIRIQNNVHSNPEIERLDALITCIRNNMYAAKSIKDAIPDLQQLQNSSNDVKYELYIRLRGNAQQFLDDAEALVMKGTGDDLFDHILAIYRRVQKEYSFTLREMYEESKSQRLTAAETSTILNLNREMITAYKSIVFALKDFLLSAEKSAYFDELPGFIR